EQYAGSNVSLSLPSTRVDAFNVTLANELSRNGRRSGLTFAPEGGSERIRKVINKMVSEEDLIRTVVTAYSNGWRHVKLYFMCGLPTETDDDVVQIARLAHEVIKAGRAATGSRDIRCTVSIGGFVPKPHTPFQWAAMATPATIDRRLRLLKQAINVDRSLGRAIGFRYHDGQPSLIEGLLSRGDRRVGQVIRRVWELGGRFDGWSEHFSFDRWIQAATEVLPAYGVDLDWYTTRERDRADVPIAYSQGFTPHPKVSYASAAPTGVASEAEYLEIGLRAAVDPDDLVKALDAALSPGLDVLEAVVAAGGSLADRIDASLWRIELPGVGPAQLSAAVEAFRAAPEVPVQRLTKQGWRTFDARGPVARIGV